MQEVHQPAEITPDEVTFRHRTRDDGDDLLLVDIDHPGITRRCLTLTEEQSGKLAPHTVAPNRTRMARIIDQDEVTFAVTFELDCPPDQRTDRSAVFDHGEGDLFIRLPDGTEYQFGLAPDLAQKLSRCT